MSPSGGDRAVVVGGGVIGAACAYFLAKAGWRVTVLEANAFGMGCSHANCGFVCPSHVLPLTEPGAVRRAVKSLFQPNSPFRIKPRLDPRLWSWFWHFARRCNRADMIEAGRARKPLLDSSMTLYEHMLAEEQIECEWERRGLLFVYKAEEEFEAYAETDRLLRDEFGVAALRLDRRQLLALEPALKEEAAGGWYYEHEAHLRPDKLMSAWRKVLERLGVELWEGAELIQFRA
ncbi:MAG TPA: FAD-dependent oxidoreductase, partial [Planctomycetaceae bacterium]|nr:FAD-dependent oxidoreductase [Planctomycetaceae bacterium]